jgi:glutamate dehydrogenase (NADP+)
VVTLSDSNGSIVDEGGIDEEKWAFVIDLKNVRRGRIKEYADKFKGAKYVEGKRPWGLTKTDIALPSATQNEIDLDDAKALVDKGCLCVSEGANMPTTLEATEFFISKGLLFGPGKAANAGGVACSGLEMSQNSMRLAWPREEVDEKLHRIMVNIHDMARKAAEEYGTPGNYVNGANIAGFKKVADAMIDQGLV